jgi:hypothetical protein
MPAQNVVGMFDGADDEDVPAHAWKRTAEDSPPTAPRKKGVAAMRYARPLLGSLGVARYGARDDYTRSGLSPSSARHGLVHPRPSRR